MTLFLDVIAASRCSEEEAELPPVVEVEVEDVPAPPVLPSPSGVFLIHVAPSPRLDPSKPEDLEIVAADDDLATFIID